jgi:hypothetical protein
MLAADRGWVGTEGTKTPPDVSRVRRVPFYPSSCRIRTSGIESYPFQTCRYFAVSISKSSGVRFNHAPIGDGARSRHKGAPSRYFQGFVC